MTVGCLGVDGGRNDGSRILLIWPVLPVLPNGIPTKGGIAKHYGNCPWSDVLSSRPLRRETPIRSTSAALPSSGIH